jgi:hypothetical protein
MRLLTLLFALSALLTVGCSSSGGRDSRDLKPLLEVSYAAPDCTCGSEDALLHGCEAEVCLSGAGDSQNPECFCYSPLSAGGFAAGGVRAGHGGGVTQVGASASQRERYIYLRSGKSYKGVVQSDDGQTLELLTVGGNELSIGYEALAPRTVYSLRQAEVPPGDFDGQLRIANYARDNDLYGYARRHYERALRADRAREEEVEREVAVLRRYASEAELAKAREALAAHDARGARRHLSNLMEEFPGEPAADAAAALFEEEFAVEREEQQNSRALRSEQVARALEPAQRHLDRATEHVRSGLKNARKQTQAIHSYQAALTSAKRSYDLLDRLERRSSSGPELLAAVEAMKTEVKEVGVAAHVHAASAYLVRGSHYNAIESANAALAIDPNNAEARSIRRRAEDDLSDPGWGWRWYPGRLPGQGVPRPRPRPTPLPSGRLR